MTGQGVCITVLLVTHRLTNLVDRRGNRVLVGITVLNIFLYAFAKVYYIWRNKQREKVWDQYSQQVSASVLFASSALQCC